jgi:mono/diheme cytochrome c family protein
LASAPVAAQQMSYAQAEFLNSCAPCHGKEGFGDGPLAAQLSRPPANLTVLSKNNGGEFPFDRVFATIDGNFMLPAHGEREMPVWGRQFLFQDMDDFGEKMGRQVTEARIQELTRYVESLQR